MIQIDGNIPEGNRPDSNPSEEHGGDDHDLHEEAISPLGETPISPGPQERALLRKDALMEHLQSNGVDGQNALEWAQIDGCLTVEDPAIWSLVNAHFASGAGYDDGVPREVIPVGIPGHFTVESVCNALASRFGRAEGSDLSPKEFVLNHLEELVADRGEPSRGTEGLHIAIQLEPVEKLLALSLALPEDMRELDRKIWEPLEQTRAKYRAAIAELSDFLDELNEDYLATFSLCLPQPRSYVGESIRDTIWP
jgi:hypothetical protein